MKLRNSPSHRWSATEEVFVRLLRYWGQIRNSFIEEGIPFPIAHDRELMLILMEAYFGVLDDPTPLSIFDPAIL